MFARLREPGGVIGSLSLAAAIVLAVVGVVGCVALLVSAATGSNFWSDALSDQLVGAGLFALSAVGAGGFLLMDRQPWQGGVLAVVGSLAYALLLWWAIIPLVLGLMFAVVAVVRARGFHAHPTADTPGHATA